MSVLFVGLKGKIYLLYFDIIPVFWDIKGTDNQMWYCDSSIMTTPRYFILFLFFFTVSKQQYWPGMIILTMQLQRIVAKKLGNLKTINLLLSCLCKKAFCNDNGHRHAEICKYRLGDMTTNYHRIRSKFSRTAKVVIDRAFILLQRSIFYVDLSWINFSQRASHCDGLYG